MQMYMTYEWCALDRASGIGVRLVGNEDGDKWYKNEASDYSL